jgi:hypothetical protein
VLLPLWQAQLALSYAAIGVLRALYAGVMAGLQVPVAGAAQRIGGARTLAAGTAAAGAYLLLGASSGVTVLAIALVLGGIGSSLATAYERPRSRGALGTCGRQLHDETPDAGARLSLAMHSVPKRQTKGSGKVAPRCPAQTNG